MFFNPFRHEMKYKVNMRSGWSIGFLLKQNQENKSNNNKKTNNLKIILKNVYVNCMGNVRPKVLCLY